MAMERTTTPAEDFLDRALLEEAAKKSGLLWVRQSHRMPLSTASCDDQSQPLALRPSASGPALSSRAGP